MGYRVILGIADLECPGILVTPVQVFQDILDILVQESVGILEFLATLATAAYLDTAGTQDLQATPVIAVRQDIQATLVFQVILVTPDQAFPAILVIQAQAVIQVTLENQATLAILDLA